MINGPITKYLTATASYVHYKLNKATAAGHAATVAFLRAPKPLPRKHPESSRTQIPRKAGILTYFCLKTSKPFCKYSMKASTSLS